MRRRRALSREDQANRRQAILQAARAAWEDATFDSLTMAEVARRAHLAKGTLYLYFSTKEELLLALLESHLDLCLTELEHRLNASSGPYDPDQVAELVVSGLQRDPALTRLMIILGTILEHNVSTACIRQFKSWLLDRMKRTGALLEAKCSFLRPGDGLRSLLQVHTLVAGLGHLAQPAPKVARVLAEPGYEALRIDFASELRQMLVALLRSRAEAPTAATSFGGATGGA